MKRILVLGAGYSSPSLIRYLLKQSETHDWRVEVADLDRASALRIINGHTNGTALPLDARDSSDLNKLIGNADIVANLLAPAFQPIVAEICLEKCIPAVSASYENPTVAQLNSEAERKGTLILN